MNVGLLSPLSLLSEYLGKFFFNSSSSNWGIDSKYKFNWFSNVLNIISFKASLSESLIEYKYESLFPCIFSILADMELGVLSITPFKIIDING